MSETENTKDPETLVELLKELKSVNQTVQTLKSQNDSLNSKYDSLQSLILEETMSDKSDPRVPAHTVPDFAANSKFSHILTASQPVNSSSSRLLTPAFTSAAAGSLGSTLSKPVNVSSVVPKPVVSSDSQDSPAPKRVKKKKPKKHRKKKKFHHRSSSSSSSSSDSEDSDVHMKQLLDGYDQAKPRYLEDKTTGPIHDGLARLLENWFWTPFTTDEVKDLLLKPVRPSNADALIPCRINEAVFYNILGGGANKDQHLRFVQNAFVKACQPLALVWSKLIQVENFFNSHDEECSFDLSKDLHVDFHELRTQLDLSLRLMGVANSQMVLHRRESLASFLNPDFSKLCKPHVKFNQWMFGSDFKTLLQDTIRENQLIKKGQTKPKGSQSQGQQQNNFLGSKKGFRRFQRRGKQFGSKSQNKSEGGFNKGSTQNGSQQFQLQQKPNNKKSQ